jgi:hypothetical protein
METQNNIHKMEKQALTVFIVLAAASLGAALGYCYLTNRLMEMGLLGASTFLLSIVVVQTYRSL